MDRGFVVLLALALGGCFRSEKPVHYYMLHAETGGHGAASGDGPLVGLGPVRIPAYLDRSQIVSALSGQEYTLSDEHRWAERLEVTIARVSAENLARMIPTDRIVLHPWARDARPDLQVAIEIRDLYLDAAGTARLGAQWTLRSNDRPNAVTRSFNCSQAAAPGDFARMVEAESRCLARLNRDIADAVRDLTAPVAPTAGRHSATR